MLRVDGAAATLWRWSAGLALLVGLATAHAGAQSSGVDEFFDRFTAEWMRANPDLAAARRYFTGTEQERLERQMTPWTVASQRARIALSRQGLADLARFDRGSMTATQRVSAELMEARLRSNVEGEPFLDHSFPLDQFGGANVTLVETLTVTHPLLTEKDASNYIARLEQVRVRMDEAVAEGQRLATAGMIPPRFILQATIKQMRDFIAAPPAQNAFVTTLSSRLAAVRDVAQPRRDELASQAASVVERQLYPAWQRGLALLETLVPRATDEAGLWRLKDGDRAYAYALKRFTTTDLSADAIHTIGLREVARIEAEMDAILRRLDRTQGSVNERMKRLEDDLRYPDPTSEASRAQIMRDIDAFIRDAERRAVSLFSRRPAAAVVAQPFPRFREANAAANYNAPSADGSRPGTFQFPLRPQRMTKVGLRTLVYHETVPGHHFQIALELENKQLPRFRQVRALGSISALNEGWALYAERLANESGWYEGDSEGLLGQLNAELFRARRLVVDTGLHAKRWTRQQAIDYGIEASEVERYVVYPGQACSYMIGQLRILELRERAKRALGARFSLQQFHDVLLETGTVPLDVLERQVDAYIRTTLH